MSTTTLPPASFPAAAGARGRLRALVRGRTGDPPWIRPALVLVLAVAAVLSLWGLTRSGYSNEYYAAAVKSASESWTAWFFGSLDPGSFITVDKPPLSLWLMGLSARVLGFSSLSMLLPEALCAIGAVALLYATVRRVLGPAAGVLAAALLAVSPVAIAVGRVNNPDALLVLLLVLAGWLLVRALESGRTKHLAWCGAVVGLAFMTKMLQGWMIVPALAAAYLLAGPPRVSVRIRQLLVAGAAMVAVSAAWPAAVSLWPASSRPYIGGSEDGSVWNLILGYNGLGRVFGASGNPGGVGGGGGGFGGTAGVWRLFNEQVGGQIAWLLPLAAVGLGAGLWLTRRTPRTGLARAGWVLFGVWALVHAVVFSFAQGIFHPYYTSAMAPAVAALAGAGVVALWRWARSSWAGVVALDLAVIGTAWVAVALLHRTPDFAPVLRTAIPVAAALVVFGSVALRLPGTLPRGAVAVAAVAAALAVAGGPAAYSVATAGRSLDGNNVTAGPASAASTGGPGGEFRVATSAGGGPGAGGAAGASSGSAAGAATTEAPSSSATGAATTEAPSSSATGAATAGAPSGSATGAATTEAPSGSATGAATAGRPDGGGLSATTLAYLIAHQGSAKYLVAATGSQTTAGIIIQTGKPVVTIGGFNGGDPAPTVSQLAAMVHNGELRYVLLSSAGFGGRDGGNEALSTWVQQHGTAVTGAGTTSGMTLYRVTA